MVTKKERNEIEVDILQKQVDSIEYKIRDNTRNINKLANENSYMKKQKSELYSVIQKLRNVKI